MVISDRLNILVNENSKGNSKAFAENAGIKQATFHNYIKKGRPPTADALNNICNKYGVNLNWLVAGIGPKYLGDQEEKKGERGDPLLDEIAAWLREQKEGEQEGGEEDINAWFRVQFGKSFPEFKEWLKKQNQAVSQAPGRQAA